MPRSSHRPETPVPVPISTTARASSTEARNRRAAAAAGADRDDADLLGAGARVGQDLVLGDELLGVGSSSRASLRVAMTVLLDAWACSGVRLDPIAGPRPERCGNNASVRHVRAGVDPCPASGLATPGHLSSGGRILGSVAGLPSGPSQGTFRSVGPGDPFASAPPSWEQIVERPLRAGLPAGLPPHRQPPRRRGPHPGSVRAGLPVAAHLHPGHHGGLAAPDHHQPVPRPGPPQAADPLRRPQRRGRRAGCPARCPRPTSPSWTGSSTPTSRPRSPRSPPTSAPPSCCATSRASPTRRSPTCSGLKLGTVRSRIHRGRAQLRTALAHRAPRAGPDPLRRPAARTRPRRTGAVMLSLQRSHRRQGVGSRGRPALPAPRRSGRGRTCSPAPAVAGSWSARGGPSASSAGWTPPEAGGSLAPADGSLYAVDAWAAVDKIEQRSRRRRTTVAVVGSGAVAASVLGPDHRDGLARRTRRGPDPAIARDDPRRQTPGAGRVTDGC